MRWFILFFIVFQTYAQDICRLSSEEKGKINYTASNGVISGDGRSYFYLSPVDDCENKVFLIPGDKITYYKEYNGYVFVDYISREGKNFNGWMKKNRIADGYIDDGRIGYSDFSVFFNKVKISLGDPISFINKELKTNNKPVSYSYVGFSDSGSAYVLDFPGDNSSAIYFSSINSDVRGDDEEIISQITLQSSDYKTKRNITIGNTLNDVSQAYGTGGKKEGAYVTYVYMDMILSFQFDKNNKITAITYSIQPQSSH